MKEHANPIFRDGVSHVRFVGGPSSLLHHLIDVAYDFCLVLKYTCFRWGVVCGMTVLALGGCRSTMSSAPVSDAKATRYSRDAAEAFAEGKIEEAIQGYRRAVHRAWAMDDPAEAGTNAYNLAATLVSAGQNEEARRWLVDAKVEFRRAGMSAGNAYLLEAKILQSEGRLAESKVFIDRAACAEPPCGDDACCETCSDQSCCFAKLPCVGPCIEEKQREKNCEAEYELQLHLARARLAAEMYDVECAKAHFKQACELADGLCSESLFAELQNTAALIHLAIGQQDHAAMHLDREAYHLRRAGNYREIPVALDLAAAAYEQSGRLEIAADRLCRVARIWFARGEFQKSWSIVQRALPWAEFDPCGTTQIRLGLLAREIEIQLGEQGASLDSLHAPEEMLSMEPVEIDLSWSS